MFVINKNKLFCLFVTISTIFIFPSNSIADKYNWNNIEGELGELIDKKIVGRTKQSEITLFNSIGNAIQDLIVASLVIEKNVKL